MPSTPDLIRDESMFNSFGIESSKNCNGCHDKWDNPLLDQNLIHSFSLIHRNENFQLRVISML